MNFRFLVNRTPEMKLLEAILQPEARRRILLLRGQPGFGKSLLLENFCTTIEARGHELALIKLDRGGIGPVGALAALCHQWGWGRFPAFDQAMAKLATPPTVEVSRNLQVGFNSSEIRLPENPAQRQAQLHILTSAWFQDAQICLPRERPAVIIIDTYNLEASADRAATVSLEFQSWIEESFLTLVGRTPALRLILAGQQTPDPEMSAWAGCCQHHTLGPIDSPEEWQLYAAHVGSRATREVISAFCHAERGHPYTIAMKLTALRDWSLER